MTAISSSLPEGAGAPNPGDQKPGDDAPVGTPGTGDDICAECQGSGSILGHACEACQGTGIVNKGIGGG
jgi:hypothetical protein